MTTPHPRRHFFLELAWPGISSAPSSLRLPQPNAKKALWRYFGTGNLTRR